MSAVISPVSGNGFHDSWGTYTSVPISCKPVTSVVLTKELVTWSFMGRTTSYIFLCLDPGTSYRTSLLLCTQVPPNWVTTTVCPSTVRVSIVTVSLLSYPTSRSRLPKVPVPTVIPSSDVPPFMRPTSYRTTRFFVYRNSFSWYRTLLPLLFVKVKEDMWYVKH